MDDSVGMDEPDVSSVPEVTFSLQCSLLNGLLPMTHNISSSPIYLGTFYKF